MRPEKDLRSELNVQFDRALTLLKAVIARDAVGARWGFSSEQTFHDLSTGLLEDSFGVEVINVTEFDDAGEVFGRPDQVELDIIIQDGTFLRDIPSRLPSNSEPIPRPLALPSFTLAKFYASYIISCAHI